MNLSPFPHSPSSSSFSLHFLSISSFSFFFFILSPFPHYLSIYSSFSHSLSIFLVQQVVQPWWQLLVRDSVCDFCPFLRNPSPRKGWYCNQPHKQCIWLLNKFSFLIISYEYSKALSLVSIKKFHTLMSANFADNIITSLSNLSLSQVQIVFAIFFILI